MDVDLHEPCLTEKGVNNFYDEEEFNYEDFEQFEYFDKIEESANNNEKKEKSSWRYCSACNVEAIEDINLSQKLICPNCGIEIQNINDTKLNFSTSIHYNTSQYNSVTTKIEGKNSYAHNKSLRGTCSNYNAWKSKKDVKYLNNCSYDSETDKIPPYINEAVIKEFEKIRRVKTFRGPVQIGIKAVLAYYMCPAENLARKPSEMANLHGIRERDLSKADSLVRSFIEEKVIELEVNQNHYHSFVDRYIALLEIDPKWRPVIISIIEKAEEKHVYIRKTPKLSTKCIGSIYLIIMSVPSLKKRITKDEIAKKCNISKTTFLGQYQLLLTNKNKLKKVFKKYRLTFPEAK